MNLSKGTVTVNSVSSLIASIERYYTGTWSLNSDTIKYINGEILSIVCDFITDIDLKSSKKIDGYGLSKIDKRSIKIDLSVRSDMVRCVVYLIYFKPEKVWKKAEFLLDISNIPVIQIP